MNAAQVCLLCQVGTEHSHTTPAPARTAADDLLRCRHCGRPPEQDGDHSCPCPYSDDACPDHPLSERTRLIREQQRQGGGEVTAVMVSQATAADNLLRATADVLDERDFSLSPEFGARAVLAVVLPAVAEHLLTTGLFGPSYIFADTVESLLPKGTP